MRWQGVLVALLSLLVLGMTSGSVAATVWGVPAGQATGRTDEGIDPHLQVSGAYGGVSVSFSVSWNDHHGAAWGLYQYGLYDDTINKFILFSHGYKYSVKNYQTPLIHTTRISYSVDINMGYTYGYISSWGGYNIVTPYHITVKEKVSHLLGGSDTKTIVDTSGTLQGYIPDPNKVLSMETAGN